MDAWTLPASIYDAMAARAEADYPEETCGFVFGPDGALEVVPMRNVQNELHRRDPKTYDRDARKAYHFDHRELRRVLDEKEREGKALRAIYHSHPDYKAYFSPKDREDAAPPGLGPLFPDAVYIVFSVMARRVDAVKGFAWSEQAADFIDIPIRRGA